MIFEFIQRAGFLGGVDRLANLYDGFVIRGLDETDRIGESSSAREFGRNELLLGLDCASFTTTNVDVVYSDPNGGRGGLTGLRLALNGSDRECNQL